jgi:hypothetical protein
MIGPKRAGSRWPVTPTCCQLCHQARLPRATCLLPVLGIRQNDTNRSNPHKAISTRMHDCLRTAVASPAERGLQAKADAMNSVSRRNMLAAPFHG